MRKTINRLLALCMAVSILTSMIGLAPALAANHVEIVTPKYDSVGSFSDGMAWVELNGHFGYVNKAGEEVIPLAYKSAKNFYDGLAVVSWYDNSCFFIDKSGNKIIKPENDYDDISNFSEGLARAGIIARTYPITLSGVVISEGRDMKYGFIDETGREVIPLKYDYAEDFCEGLAKVGLNRKYGFIDRTGKEIVPLKYDYAYDFCEGLARVQLNDGEDVSSGKYGFIDRTGKEVIPLKYDYTYSFHDNANSFYEGLARVQQNGKYGFIDKTGKEAIPLKYYFASSFSDGMALVGQYDKCGLIDKTGKEIIPLKYDPYLGSFRDNFISDGMVLLVHNGEYGLIDKAGKELTPFKYNYVHPFSDGMAAVRLNHKAGYIDKTGKEIVPLKYDDTKSFSEGIAQVKLNGKWGFISVAAGTAIPAPTGIQATPTASSVLVNGEKTVFDAYNIGGNNYFKLRDLAYVLNGTDKQFEVTWDEANNAILLTSGNANPSVGDEMQGKVTEAKTAVPASSKILLDGKEIILTAYNIGGNNYFNLRDIGQAFDFCVTWDDTKNTISIDTTAGYIK